MSSVSTRNAEPVTHVAAAEAPRSGTRSRPPRILLLQTQAENAGAQEVSRLLAAGLAARGYDTAQAFFFRRTDSYDDAPDTYFCARVRPTGPLRFLRFLMRLRACIRQLQPDAILTFQHYGNIIGAPLARIAGVRHVIATQTTTLGALHPLVRKADRLLGRAGLYGAMVVNSDVTERDHAAYPKAYKDRIVHIPHGFEQKKSAATKPDARRRFALPAGAPLLGGVGRLHPDKNWDASIRLLPQRPAWHLAIAGQGSDLDRLRALAATLECASRVHFVGELAPAEIGTFLAALDVFVFPSLIETFGLAAVEAAQAGVPVVANTLPVLREVLSVDGEPCALFADAGDIRALSAAVEQVLDDPQGTGQLVARARKLSGVYSLDDMVDGYAALIERMLAGKTRIGTGEGS